MAEQARLSITQAVWLITRRELAAQRTSFLAWALPLAGLVGLVAALQPQVAGQSGLMAAKLALMPEAMKQAFSLANADFSRPVGYLAANFITVTMGATMFTGLLGAGVVAREDTQRTSEALLTLPLARWQVLVGKALAVAGLLLGLHLLVGGVGVLVLWRAAPDAFEGGLVAAMFAGAALLGATFAAAGGALAVALRQARAAPNASLGLVLGVWLLGAVAKLTPSAAEASAWSPFALVEPQEIVRRGGLGAGALWLPAVTLALLAGAVFWYERRDVHG